MPSSVSPPITASSNKKLITENLTLVFPGKLKFNQSHEIQDWHPKVCLFFFFWNTFFKSTALKTNLEPAILIPPFFKKLNSLDRKSAVEGKVVDLGGCRLLKKKKNNITCN